MPLRCIAAIVKFCALVGRWENWETAIKLWYGYGSIPINTIFSGMNIHLPAILGFTRGTRFWPIPIHICGWWWLVIVMNLAIHRGFHRKNCFGFVFSRNTMRMLMGYVYSAYLLWLHFRMVDNWSITDLITVGFTHGGHVLKVHRTWIGWWCWSEKHSPGIPQGNHNMTFDDRNM